VGVRERAEVQYSTVQPSAVHYSTVQYSLVYSTVQYSTVQPSAVQYITAECSTVHYSRSAVLYTIFVTCEITSVGLRQATASLAHGESNEA
jgi:hypothetical protein